MQNKIEDEAAALESLSSKNSNKWKKKKNQQDLDEILQNVRVTFWAWDLRALDNLTCL